MAGGFQKGNKPKRVNSSERLKRALRVMFLLNGGDRTMEEMADAVGCHKMTMWRDLCAMRGAGLPIKMYASKRAGKRGYTTFWTLGEPLERFIMRITLKEMDNAENGDKSRQGEAKVGSSTVAGSIPGR